MKVDLREDQPSFDFISAVHIWFISYASFTDRSCQVRYQGFINRAVLSWVPKVPSFALDRKISVTFSTVENGNQNQSRLARIAPWKLKQINYLISCEPAFVTVPNAHGTLVCHPLRSISIHPSLFDRENHQQVCMSYKLVPRHPSFVNMCCDMYIHQTHSSNPSILCVYNITLGDLIWNTNEYNTQL